MKKWIFNILTGSAVVALAMAGSANASTTFDFTSMATNTNETIGNSLSLTSGGLTATETAWWLGNTTTPSSSTDFQQSSVQVYNGNGIGACNPTEIAAGCGSPIHQIDNNAQLDFVLITFSAAVNLSSVANDLTLLHYANIGTNTSLNASLTYWTNVTLTTSTTWGSLGSGTTITNGCSTPPCSVSDDLTGSNVTSILIAAQTSSGSGNDDAFKIQSLTVSSTGTTGSGATPEPATFGLLGSALLFFGTMAIRRRSALNNS